MKSYANICEIYGSDGYDFQKSRYEEAGKAFNNHFSQNPLFFYSSPGRVEIIGNHTDHQRGKVIASAVDLDIIAAIIPCEDIIEIKSQGFDDLVIFPIDNLDFDEKESNKSILLAKGTLKYLQEKGYKIGGFKGFFQSEIPEGSGLSSSAAFEILIAEIISNEYNNGEISPVEMALAGQFAENSYMKKPSGLMDQMAISMGGLTFLDFSAFPYPKYEVLKLIPEDFGYNLCVVNTKESHGDLTKEYRDITSEMAEIAGFFEKEFLCQVSEYEFFRNIGDLRKKFGERSILRAMHFFEENNRVETLKTHIKIGNFHGFLEEINRSGLSSSLLLQNIYSERKPIKQGLSLALALTEKILGSECGKRVHGGGFAGTILVFLPNEKVNNYAQKMDEVFSEGAYICLKLREKGPCKVLF